MILEPCHHIQCQVLPPSPLNSQGHHPFLSIMILELDWRHWVHTGTNLWLKKVFLSFLNVDKAPKLFGQTYLLGKFCTKPGLKQTHLLELVVRNSSPISLHRLYSKAPSSRSLGGTFVALTVSPLLFQVGHTDTLAGPEPDAPSKSRNL